jgi:hypothetical protein
MGWVMISLLRPNNNNQTRKEDTGMNYIGVDCHISTLDFAVVDGKRLIKKKACANTGVKEFMEFVRSIPKPGKIFIEEGELANWLSPTTWRKNTDFLRQR